ncbi:alpha/beta hydrolase [Micromonospora sp. BQ11]|uniref:alpha/beta hydrolase n=1 Tax=Micromonospora sp. BQ11 TaxID=3452212 RepID=UPI003F8BBCF6
MALVLALASGGGVAVAADRRSGPVPPVSGQGSVQAALPGRAVCRTVTYTPVDTEPQVGDLCRPAEQRDTLVILVHGGGGVQGSRTHMAAWSARLGSAGYPTLSIDYTLYDPQTVEPPVFPRPEQDVKTAIQWVRMKAPTIGVHPDRIVMLGTSAGARLAGLMLVTADTRAFPAQGAWPGVSTRLAGLVGFYGGYNGGMLNPEPYYGGPRDSTAPAVRRRWTQADATAQAARASGPALLVHGDADTVAPVAQTRRFGDALTAAGRDAEVVVVQGVGHSFDRAKKPGRPLTAEGEQSAQRVLAWLSRIRH